MVKNRRVAGKLAAAAIAIVSAGAVTTAPASAVSEPAPVTQLVLSSRDAVVYVDWTPSVDTGSADVCWKPDVAPAVVDDPAATCSGVLSASGYSFEASAGTQLGVSVFAYATGTNTYGAPTTATLTVVDDAPAPPVALVSSSYGGAHTLDVYWRDNPANRDTADYVVDWAPGTGQPPLDTSDQHVTTSRRFFVGNLNDGVVYTFAIYVRDSGGHVGAPAFLRAATRQAGAYLVSTDSADGEPVLSKPGPYFVKSVAASMNSAGHLRTVQRTSSDGIYYFSRTRAGTWSTSRFIGSRAVATPVIAAPPTGSKLLVAWPSQRGVVTRMRSAGGAWETEHLLTSNRSDRVVGAVYDGTRGHLVVRRPTSSTSGLWYFTFSGGHWTKSRIGRWSDAAALAQDQITHRVVVVDNHRASGLSTLRVAVISPLAKIVSGWRTWHVARNGVNFVPTSVASDSGRIALGLQRRTAGGSSFDGPFVQTGTATAHQRVGRVASTNRRDDTVVVTSLQPSRVMVSWRRTSASWAPSSLGMWTVLLTRASSGRYSYGTPVHRSSSAYDVPVQGYRDDGGHYYALYYTTGDDVVE